MMHLNNLVIYDVFPKNNLLNIVPYLGRLLFFIQVGHTKGYMQVLVVGPGSMLGTSAIIRITSVGRWSVFGEVIETLTLTKDTTESKERSDRSEKCCSLTNIEGSCACVGELDACACGHESCGQNLTEEKGGSLLKNDSWADDRSNSNIFGWLLRKRKNHRTKKIDDDTSGQQIKRQESAAGSAHLWTAVDRLLLGGMCASFLTILALFLYFASSILSS